MAMTLERAEELLMTEAGAELNEADLHGIVYGLLEELSAYTRHARNIEALINKFVGKEIFYDCAEYHFMRDVDALAENTGLSVLDDGDQHYIEVGDIHYYSNIDEE